MKVVPFTAKTPAAALLQIHQQLGPDAVVLAIRPNRSSGLARFWPGRPSVEVLAGVEENPAICDSARVAISASQSPEPRVAASPLKSPPPLNPGDGRPHVLIGPPGVGKTTLLCKWLAQAILTEQRSARVWRIDGASANTAEFLSLYGELLGSTVERFWTGADAVTDLLLLDLPGVETSDAVGLAALKEQLATLGSTRLHLVLNAAYDNETLADQFHAFESFQPEDLSFTHLDEVRESSRAMTFALGTNCSVRFLTAGQKVPGELWSVEEASRPTARTPR